jgi:hypothetical protein
MSTPSPSPHGNPKRRRPPAFRPRFTIGVFYLVVFFFLFSLLQVLPDLIALLEMPPGPEQEVAAREAAHQASDPLTASILSLIATSLGSFYRILPGMRVD